MSIETLISEMARAQASGPGREKPIAVDANEIFRRARGSNASVTTRDINEFMSRLNKLPIAQREYVLRRLRAGLSAVVVQPPDGQEPARPTAFVPVYFPRAGVAGAQGAPFNVETPGMSGFGAPPEIGPASVVDHFLAYGRTKAGLMSRVGHEGDVGGDSRGQIGMRQAGDAAVANTYAYTREVPVGQVRAAGMWRGGGA